MYRYRENEMGHLDPPATRLCVAASAVAAPAALKA